MAPLLESFRSEIAKLVHIHMEMPKIDYVSIVFTFFSTIIVSSNYYFFFKDEKKGGWPCPDCVYVSKYNKTDTMEHFQNWHWSRTENWPCTECGKAFLTSWYMKVHFQEEHNRYKCGVCGKFFKCIASLAAHNKSRIKGGTCPFDSKAPRESRRPLGLVHLYFISKFRAIFK